MILYLGLVWFGLCNLAISQIQMALQDGAKLVEFDSVLDTTVDLIFFLVHQFNLFFIILHTKFNHLVDVSEFLYYIVYYIYNNQFVMFIGTL